MCVLFTECAWLGEQAFLVTVRNKKRVGYNYELTLKVRGKLACIIVSFPVFQVCMFHVDLNGMYIEIRGVEYQRGEKDGERPYRYP